MVPTIRLTENNGGFTMEITRERVSKYLRYEPDTGNFYWIADTNPRGPSKVGQRAGAEHDWRRYIRIVFFKHQLYAHRLAWLITYGYMPDEIDHINGNASDNRLCNLREATRTQNNGNRDGVRGYFKYHNKFVAKIEANGIQYALGSFDTESEARAAYDNAADRLFGEFARVNRPLDKVG